MISRYTRPEMAEIWTDDKKYDCWLAVEPTVILYFLPYMIILKW